MRRARWLLGAVAAFACGPVSPPPEPLAPINGCSTAADCADYVVNPMLMEAPQCTPYPYGNACTTVDTTLSFLLVVSFPEGSYTGTNPFLGPGATFVVSEAELLNSVNGLVILPSPIAVGGAYLVQPSVAQTVGRNLYNPIRTTLPVKVTYWPQWSSSNGYVDAPTVGLPLPPVVADVESPPPWPAMDAYAPPTASSGVGGGPQVGWSAVLPPLGSGGGYERVVMVDAPFDDAFPPDVGCPGSSPCIPPVADAPALVGQFDDLLGGVQTHMVNVNLPPGTPVEGLQVFARVAATGRPVSNVVTLHGLSSSASTNLFTLSANVAQGQWEFVARPPDSALPTFSQPILGVPNDYTVPPLQLAGTLDLKGVVTSFTGDGTQASVVFVSTNIQVVGESPTTFLTYQTSLTTDPSGHFDVTLPMGTYDAILTPFDPTLAKVTKTFLAERGPQPSLVIDPPITVTGTCTIGDMRGTLLAGADVELTPAVSLWQTAETQPPVYWPRPAHAVTGRDGTFRVAVDPGTYDITVKPAAGSRLPWVVSPAHNVMQDMAFETLVTPVPVLEPVTLQDYLPVASALVRAYASASDGTYYEIGDGFTDVNGHVDLFLTRLVSP